jgi:hypothetical protein
MRAIAPISSLTCIRRRSSAGVDSISLVKQLALRHSGMRREAQARNPSRRDKTGRHGFSDVQSHIVVCSFHSRPGMTMLHASAFPPRKYARVIAEARPSEDQRAQGMPGARCARSLACKNKKHASKSPRSHRRHPAFPAHGFNGLFRGLPGDRAFLPPSPRNALALPRVDTSVEISGRHDFAVRDTRIVSCVGRVHRISCPTFCDDRETPLMRAEDARKTAGDLPVVTSENICGKLALRANQLRRRNSCQVKSNCFTSSFSCDKRKAFARRRECNE